jgi:hypothetical protein
MTAWLKTFRRGNELSPRESPDEVGSVGEQRLFYEPLSTYSDGSPKLTKHGEPMGRPNYQTGDLIAEYWNGTYEVGPSLWEVVGEPEQAQRVGWGWQTRVRLVAKDLSILLDDLDIAPRSLARRVRLRLDSHQESLLEAFAGIRRGTARAPGPAVQVDPTKLADSIVRLPEAEKLVVSLVYYENLSLTDAGAMLGLSEGEAQELHDAALLRLNA